MVSTDLITGFNHSHVGRLVTPVVPAVVPEANTAVEAVAAAVAKPAAIAEGVAKPLAVVAAVAQPAAIIEAVAKPAAVVAAVAKPAAIAEAATKPAAVVAAIAEAVAQPAAIAEAVAKPAAIAEAAAKPAAIADAAAKPAAVVAAVAGAQSGVLANPVLANPNVALELPGPNPAPSRITVTPSVETTSQTTVKTSVVTAPPGAAQVKVVTASSNQNSSSVTSGTGGSSRPPGNAGGGGVDLVTGGGGLVGFSVRFGDSPITAPQRIADFVFGQDRMSLRSAKGKLQAVPRSFSRADNNSSATTLRELAASVFADADGLQAGDQALRRGAAVLVRATSAEIRGTYLLVNNGNLRLDPTNDLMLRLTGFSGRLPAVGAIDPAAVFG
jgi:hypothetical protein